MTEASLTEAPPPPRPARWYTADQVADRIGETLGKRPAAAAVRREASRAAQAPRGRGRLTAGLPGPAAGSGTRRYPADAVEQWLTHHPRLRTDALLQALHQELAASKRDGRGARLDLVAAAKDDGLSWAQIAAVLGAVDNQPITRQAVAARYGPLIGPRR